MAAEAVGKRMQDRTHSRNGCGWVERKMQGKNVKTVEQEHQGKQGELSGIQCQQPMVHKGREGCTVWTVLEILRRRQHY